MANEKENETIMERKDRQKAEQDIERAKKKIKGLKMVLDTNILITGCDGNSLQKTAITDIAAQNDTYICDTVFWEFSRNCGLPAFRKRLAFLLKSGLLKMIPENNNVQKMFESIWITYLCCYQKEPKRMIAVVVPDLWIVSAAVQQDIDTILTTDNSGDFPDELFDTESFYIGKEKTIHLKKFNRKKAREYLKNAFLHNIEILTDSFRSK